MVNQQQIQPWFCNPIQVFKTNTRLAKRRLIAYWSEFSDIVGFIDGAWKKDSVGNITASIGGFLMESKLSLIFIFSGTTEASSPYEAELAALKFVLEQLGSSNFKEYSTTIFSDSKQLVSNLLYLRSNYGGLDISYSIMIHKVNLVHIERHLNSEADSLAKEGAERSKFIYGWI